MEIRRLAFPLLFLAACAPAAAPPPPPVVAAVPVASAAGAHAASVTAQPASLSLLDAVDPAYPLVLRLDARALRATKLYTSAIAAVRYIDRAAAMLDELDQICGLPVLDAVDELVVGAGGDHEATILARVNAPPPAALACAGKLGHRFHPGDGKVVADEHGFFLDGTYGAASVRSVIISGDHYDVMRAINLLTNAKLEHSPLRPAVDVQPGAVLSFALGAVGPVESAHGALLLDDSRLGLSADAELKDPVLASELADRIKAGIASASAELGAAPQGGVELKQYLGLIKVEAHGLHLHGEMRLDGGAEAQARLIGTISAVSIYATKQYLLRSKAAEAKNTVGAIARGLAAYMEREDERGHHASRFPPSAPPTPKIVPKAVKYQPDDKTWSHPTWKAIRFEMTWPQYYSYEIETARDGRSVVVRARGDLDGNGKQSTFERRLKLGADGVVVVDPEIKIQDELE